MIGLLGGTFDPVHIAHLELAKNILNDFSLNELRLIPSFIPPHKQQPIASAEHRYQMLKLAAQGLNKIKVDNREILRKGTSYSIDTVTAIRNEISNTEPLAFIMGCDAFNQLNTWKNWQDLLGISHLIIVNRPDYPLSKEDWMSELLAKHLIYSSKELHSKPAGCIFFHQLEPVKVSATEIREQLAKNPATLSELNPAVLAYIKFNQLYGTS
jgi:nicotinate-nucleotide adenylyltransferase